MERHAQIVTYQLYRIRRIFVCGVTNVSTKSIWGLYPINHPMVVRKREEKWKYIYENKENMYTYVICEQATEICKHNHIPFKEQEDEKRLNISINKHTAENRYSYLQRLHISCIVERKKKKKEQVTMTYILYIIGFIFSSRRTAYYHNFFKEKVRQQIIV